MTAFQVIMSLSFGAALMPGGGSSWMRLKSLINRRWAAVGCVVMDIVVIYLFLFIYLFFYQQKCIIKYKKMKSVDEGDCEYTKLINETNY